MGENNSKFEARIAVVEKEGEMTAMLFERFDKTIQILTDVSNSIQKLLAVHEQRLDTLAEDAKETTKRQEIRRGESQVAIKELKVEIKKDNDIMNGKIDSINKWRFILYGVYMTAGFIIAKLPALVKIF